MKRLFLASVLIIACLGLSAQKEVPTKEQIAQFRKSKTLIVLDENPWMRYNFKIKEVVKSIWKITPYEFISRAEYENKRNSNQYSFLTLDKVWFTKDKTKAQYNFLCLSLGGKYKTESDMPQLCTLPVSYADVDEENYIFKLSGLVQIIQNHIHFVENQEGISDVNVIKRYNDNAYQIKDKTLYLVKDELSKDIDSEKKLKAIYPYSFKFVTREELENAIDKKLPNIVYLHKVGPEGTERKARCYKSMIGTEKSKLYYFDYHMIRKPKYPDGLLLKDIKKIAKAKPSK